MRAYSWLACGLVALACGGGAFSGASTGGDGGSGDDDDSGSSGKASSGGSDLGSGGMVGSGGKVGTGGRIGSGGFTGVAGDLGIAGDLVAGGSVGVSGATSTGGSGPAPIDSACPKDLPAAGRACKTGLSCSYGTDIRPSCRTRAKCEGGGWKVYESGDECAVLHACANNVAPGGACNADAAPCIYTTTNYCQCLLCSGQVCQSEPSWACVGGAGEQGCPKVIPNEGQPCSGGAKCSYGSCGVSNVVHASCDGATWGWEPEACPL